MAESAQMDDAPDAARAHRLAVDPAGAGRRVATAVVAGLLLAACSSGPAITGRPAASGSNPPAPAATAASPSAGPTSADSATSTASAAPSPAITPESPAPASTPAASGGWATVLPPVPAPGAYLDFGFGANGDVIAVGTDDVTERPATVWIARFSPEGANRGRVQVARKMTAFFGADYIEIDASDDSVLFTQVDFSTGLYHVYRVASSSGKVLERLDLHKAMNAIAATVDGRIYGITATYGGWNYKHPCIVDRVAASGGIASGVDYDLKECETLGHFAEPFYFQDPEAIDVGNDGNLLVLDWGEAGKRLHDEPAGLGLAVLTPGFDFVRRWHLPKAWQVDDRFFGIPAQGWFLAADDEGRVFIDRQDTSDDLTTSLGHRLGVFSKDGTLLATYGHGADHPGLTDPIAARPDSAGRLWVIDFDAAAKSWVVKRLDRQRRLRRAGQRSWNSDAAMPMSPWVRLRASTSFGVGSA